MRRHEWLLAAFIIVLTARLVEAQGGGSALQGRVTDEQQAVLPGVAIVVTHQENGTFRETVSGPDGAYFVPGLPPGRYRVTADLQGFKKFSGRMCSCCLAAPRRSSSGSRSVASRRPLRSPRKRQPLI